jgi:integrase/recombinase XerD
MKQAQVLSERGIKTVLNHISKNAFAARNRCMFLLALYSGMRVGEIAALEVSDVIDTNGKIRDQILLRAHQTKGNKARSVLLNTNAREEIQRYLRNNDRERHEPLFKSKAGSRFSPNSLVQVFGRIYRAAGMDLATSHSTRRTFITTLAHKGVNVRVLAAISGHASIATTQRYIDLNDNVMRAAVELI